MNSDPITPTVNVLAPTIAIVGRPNVGKSTLFNRLTRSRDAIVSDFPGLTRDRQYGASTYNGQNFIWIDTGGLSEDEAGIDPLIAAQSLQAIAESDFVLFVVDARQGMVPSDEKIASHLRQSGKEVLLVVNKVDGKTSQLLTHDFYGLGFGDQSNISAVHGRGIDQLLAHVVDKLCLLDMPTPDDTIIQDAMPDELEFSDDSASPNHLLLAQAEEVSSEQAPSGKKANSSNPSEIKIAIVGRPNVGKSTLMNRMLGETRTLVYDMPGTTRDSIYVPFERHDQSYVLIDTAGMRRRGKIERGVERFSVVKTLQAISDAQVVILVIDSREGLVDQDLHLLGFILESGKAAVIACNKWDGLALDQRKNIKAELDRRLEFANYLRIHFISALHGTGVGHLYGSIQKAYRAANTRVRTPKLTGMLEEALESHPPPLVRGRRIKLRYAHMGGVCPPLIVIHGNQTSEVPNAYRRYLQNYFRDALKIEGTPIHFEFKTGKNPYEGRVNKLTQRQLKRKRRLLKFHKK